MANMKEILPKGEYKIKTVGPPRNWEYNGTAMITDSVQFEGCEQYWIDLNRKSDSPTPQIGDVVKGHVEQDEAGKYSPKFKKESAGGWSGGNGGGKASPGAIQAQNVTTATAIVSAFYQLTGKKPKDFDAYMSKIEAVAPSVGKMVDRLVAAQPVATTTASTTNNEAGESAAPAQAETAKADVSVQDISDEELGDW